MGFKKLICYSTKSTLLFPDYLSNFLIVRIKSIGLDIMTPRQMGVFLSCLWMVYINFQFSNLLGNVYISKTQETNNINSEFLFPRLVVWTWKSYLVSLRLRVLSSTLDMVRTEQTDWKSSAKSFARGMRKTNGTENSINKFTSSCIFLQYVICPPTSHMSKCGTPTCGTNTVHADQGADQDCSPPGPETASQSCRRTLGSPGPLALIRPWS